MKEARKNQGRSRIFRKELTLGERVAIIKDSDNGQRVSQIAAQYACSTQQIRRIIRHREQYLSLWSNSHEARINTVRRLRCPLMIATNSILFEWISRARYYMDVTDDVLRSTGQVIANHLKYADFRTNNRWLNRFKQKYRLHKFRLIGLSEKNDDTSNLKSLNLEEIIEDLRRDDPSKLADFDGEQGRVKVENDDIAEEQHSNVSDEYTANFEHSSNFSKLDQGIEMDDYSSEAAVAVYRNTDELQAAPAVKSYREAINLLGPIEQFALLKENVRAVGLINQLENLFRDEMANGMEFQ